MEKFDVIIVGSGPAGLGAAFHLIEKSPKLKILILEKNKITSGGLRNDCKQNYTHPICFPADIWDEKQATECLKIVEKHLNPVFKSKNNTRGYIKRAERLGVKLIDVRQAHVGTDKAIFLIEKLISELQNLGVDIRLNEEVINIDHNDSKITVLKKNDEKYDLNFNKLIIAPGRAGFSFLQNLMDQFGVVYSDNVIDIGVRIETEQENYSIVRDYYDPKFIFPNSVRTFCTNSGCASVVQEKYDGYYSVNGHSFSSDRNPNGLVNFALLKTKDLTEPVTSGQEMGAILGNYIMHIGGGKPIMQRVGDFRLGLRSKWETFNDKDLLYGFEPTLKANPGDIGFAPSNILRDIWKAMKLLDTIVPGLLHPSTVMYFPEIKNYANKPSFIDNHFRVTDNIYMVGDGPGTSRGITAAWCSGIRAAEGILGRDLK